MSRFYASIQGSRGPATRQGTPKSGIEGHIRGWNAGVKVYGDTGADGEEDRFHVYITGGSNGHTGKRLALEVVRENGHTLWRVDGSDSWEELR